MTYRAICLSYNIRSLRVKQVRERIAARLQVVPAFPVAGKDSQRTRAKMAVKTSALRVFSGPGKENSQLVDGWVVSDQ